MIVECVGLPGAGKTTVCGRVSVPHGKKGAVPLSALRIDTALLRAAWHIFLLSLSAKPFSFNRLKRGFNLAVFLRHYQTREQTILLDQGIVQKLWSILLDTGQFSSVRMDNVVRSLRPFAPDCVVWLRVPVSIALERLVRRVAANSRFDRLEAAQAEAALLRNAVLLEDLITRFPLATGAMLYQLDGMADAVDNAACLDTMISLPKVPPPDA